MIGVVSAVGLRWLAFLLLALVHGARRRARPVARSAKAPPITVLIPSFNEERVIAATVRSVLASSYDNVRVIVVDDGSTDDTAAVVRAIAGQEPRLSVLAQRVNGGKSAALNAALATVRSALVVTVDADTRLASDAISVMVATLLDADADAVATNVRVGNRVNLWTRWQSLEYVTGLNIDRRAQAVLGVISTVPGAASAWRVAAVRACGGFSGRTLAEDTDLTLALLRAGRRVVFSPRAVAWTESPQTARELFRQRLRWLHGNLQCAWHHSEVWWTPAPWRVRLLALPNLWFAHLGVYLLLPLTLAVAGVGYGPDAGRVLGVVFGALFVLDVAAALTAYALDRGDPWDLVWAPSQRIGYPLFLWAVFATVALRILRGAPTMWNKLERRGFDNEGEGRA